MKNLDSASPKNSAPQIDSRVTAPISRPAAVPASVSLLQPELASPVSREEKPRKALKKILAVILLAILFLGGVLGYKAANLSDKIFVGQKYSFLQKIQFAIRGAFGGETLIGEDLGQINILLLGIGGEGHDGPYLSDTMIVAQIRPDTGQAALTSLPRDLLAELPENMGYRKINAAFAEGFNKRKDFSDAGKWALETTEKITGLDIPYFAVIDFQGFEKAINLLGGLEISVERSFADYEYPNTSKNEDGPVCSASPEDTGSPCRYVKVVFEAGSQHMDGKEALRFARSRHGNNGEGSDFARSIRQQKVISAFKAKALELNLIADSGKVNSLLSTFAEHFHTNINPAELFRLYGLVKDKKFQKFLSSSLDQESGLICPKILEESGAWVLVACPGKTSGDIQNYFKNSFAIGELKEEKSVVWLGTSTSDKTAYNNAYKTLRASGITVWEVGFGQDPLSENLVYQVNPKPATAEFIKNQLGAVEVTTPPPGIKLDKSRVDLVVILGEKK